MGTLHNVIYIHYTVVLCRQAITCLDPLGVSYYLNLPYGPVMPLIKISLVSPCSLLPLWIAR